MCVSLSWWDFLREEDVEQLAAFQFLFMYFHYASRSTKTQFRNMKDIAKRKLVEVIHFSVNKHNFIRNQVSYLQGKIIRTRIQAWRQLQIIMMSYVVWRKPQLQ